MTRVPSSADVLGRTLTVLISIRCDSVHSHRDRVCPARRALAGVVRGEGDDGGNEHRHRPRHTEGQQSSKRATTATAPILNVLCPWGRARKRNASTGTAMRARPKPRGSTRARAAAAARKSTTTRNTIVIALIRRVSRRLRRRTMMTTTRLLWPLRPRSTSPSPLLPRLLPLLLPLPLPLPLPRPRQKGQRWCR